MKRTFCLAVLCAATTLSAQATSPWSGTWKLDRAKSHLTGTTYTLSKGADGKWITNIGPVKFTYAPDGKPYPMIDQDHTIIATLINPHTLKSTSQFKGKTTAVSTDTLSADGKTIADVTINTPENGPAYTTTETDTRTGPGPGEGFFGTWTTSKTSSTADTPQTITASKDSITFSNPERKSTLTAKLDGTPATPVSPDMTEGITVSYKKASPTHLDFVVMLKGEKVVEGYDELSAGGKSYSDVSWLIGKESEKTTSVYIKQ